MRTAKEKNKIIKDLKLDKFKGGELNSSFIVQSELAEELIEFAKYCNNKFSAENMSVKAGYYGATQMYSSQRGQAITLSFNNIHRGGYYDGSKPYIVSIQIGGALDTDTKVILEDVSKYILNKYTFTNEFGKSRIYDYGGTNYWSVLLSSPEENSRYYTIPYFDKLPNFAKGGSLESHGIKEGDKFLKTLSGGIQKVKDKNGKIVFINLATGERSATIPLPFDDGGEVKYFLNKDGIRVRSVAKPEKKLSEREWMAKHNESKEARSYAFGGLFGKSPMMSKPKKINLNDKQVRLNSGEYVQVLDQDGDTLMVMELSKIGTGASPKMVKIDDVDMTSFAGGGEIKLSDLKVESGMGAGKKTWEVSYPKIEAKGVYFQDQYTKEEAKEHWLENVASKYKFANGGGVGSIVDKKADEFIKNLKDRGIFATKRVSKNGIFIYGEKNQYGKYKYETYLSYSEVPNDDFLEMEMSEFLRLHKKMATGGGVEGNKYFTIFTDEEGSVKTEFDNYSDALADYNYFESEDANISLYEINNGEEKLLEENISSADIEYVELSNGNIVVVLEKIDGKWKETDVLEGETPYNWGSKQYMSYLKPKELAQWLSRDYGGDFKIVEQYATGGRVKSYKVLNELYKLKSDGVKKVQLNGFNESINYVIDLGLDDSAIKKIDLGEYQTTYANGGETYSEKASQLKGGLDYYSIDIDLFNGDEIRDLTFKSLDEAKKEYLKYSNSMVYDGDDIMDIQLIAVYKNGDYENINLNKGGGVGLIGNQKRIDMNKNGKIDAEDFEIMRNTMDGAWRKDRKYVNSTSRKDGKVIDYEVRYARKNNPSRKGYKGKTFAKGGQVYNDSKFLTKEQLEKWNDYVRTGKINGKKEDNMFAVARHIGTSVAKINAYEIEQRANSKKMASGGAFVNWNKFPDKKVLGFYNVKGKDINVDVNLNDFERLDDLSYSLYPTEKDRKYFKSIKVKSTALNSLNKGLGVKAVTNDGKSVVIKRLKDLSFAGGGDLKGVKLDFNLETDGDYEDIYETEVEKIKLLREVVDFDEVVGNIDTGKTFGNTDLKFYKNDIVVMTIYGNYDTESETLDSKVDVLGNKYNINYHPLDTMGGFDSSKFKKEIEKIDYKKKKSKRDWLSFVKDNSSYFDVEEESEESVTLTTRENGNVGDEEYGIEDIEEAKSIVKKIKEKYPKTKVSIYTVDEFVYLELENTNEPEKEYAKGGEVGKIEVGDKIKVKAKGVGEDFVIVEGFDSANQVLTKSDDPNTYLAVRDSKGYAWEIYLKEVVEFPLKHKMAKGGAFEKLSDKVAKNYEGKRVKPKYQKEYGKVYSKEEAKEVGDKVAGKVKAMQKMGTGGVVETPKIYIVEYEINGKKHISEYLLYSDERVEKKLPSIAKIISIKEKMGTGGATKKGGQGGIMVLAKKIRKEGESWKDALKRAGQQLK